MHLQQSLVFLRDLSLDDVEERYAWSLDKDVIKHLNYPDRYPPFTKVQTKNWIAACINRTNGYIQKSIVTIKEQKHIGWVDLKNFDPLNRNAEFGIGIGDKAFWGQGYGSSATREMLKIGFYELGLHKIWLRVDSDNEKAIQSYERNGFVSEGIIRMSLEEPNDSQMELSGKCQIYRITCVRFQHIVMDIFRVL